ncbi:MAG: thioredoxin domain-containing protein [bacterium]
MRFPHRATGATALVLSLVSCTTDTDRRPASDTTGATGRVSVQPPHADSGTARSGADTATHPVAGAVKTPPKTAASSGQTAGSAAATPATAAPRRVLLGDVDLTGVGYDRGSPTARVVMIDFSDFGCPYCGEFTRQTYPTLEREYVNTGRVFFKYVPFIVGMFPHAAEAARAAECAADQGKFWPMADRVYGAQKAWKGADDPRELLISLAAAAGADTTALARCYTDRHTDPRTARATQVANGIGVRVTPSFVVDGRPIEGALPLAEFRKVLDAALLVQKARP